MTEVILASYNIYTVLVMVSFDNINFMWSLIHLKQLERSVYSL